MVPAVIDDDVLEAWFLRHRGSLDEVSEAAFAEVAPWLPIIGIAANDRSVRSPAGGRAVKNYIRLDS